MAPSGEISSLIHPVTGPGSAALLVTARAGLAGIVGEAGRLLVLDREAVIELADELGVFILGVEPPGERGPP